MTNLRMKTNFILVMVISLLLVGSIGNITKNIELSEKELDDLQVQCLDNLQDSGNNPVREEIRAKVDEITSYEAHDPIVINGNTNFNDTAYAEGWPGNGTVDNPYIIDGFNITGPSDSNLIVIQNTDVYFQINNCLLSSGAWAIFLNFVKNGLISNNTIIFNTRGIWIEFSHNNTCTANNISLNTGSGIWMGTAVNNTISHNLISNNGYGVQLSSAYNNTILNNTISSNTRQGMGIQTSGNLQILDNRFFNSGIDLSGLQITDFLQLEVTNNSVNNKPLVFWQNINGGTIPSGAGEVILVDCRSITVTGLNLSASTVGLSLAYSTNCTVYNNTVSSNRRGIWLAYSDENALYNNSLSENDYAGIYLHVSGGNNVYDNNISFNAVGIYLYNTGITGNKFYANIISHNNNGFNVIGSANNVFVGNTISDSDNYGVILRFTKNNLILWNEFINNNPSGPFQGFDDSNPSLANLFEFNYWSDWTTPDMNSDGIVDNPYTIDGDSNNQDSHPLTTPMHLSPATIIFPNGDNSLNGIVTIQWSSAIDRWGHSVTYTVYYSNDNGGTWFSLISGLDTTSYQWDTTTVTDGTDYMVKVVTICSAGVTTEDISDSTFIIQNAVVAPPSSPQSLTATAGELFIYLTWTVPSNDGGSAITGYQVYRGTSSGAYTLIFITSDTNYNDTLVNGGVTYYYVVTAINDVGESGVSSEVSATPTEPTVIQPVVSSAPQSLTATAGELFVYLTWTTPSSDGGSAITGYHIYRGTSSGEYTVTFATLSTNYNDTLVGGVTYYYVVTAINAVGESVTSSEVNVTPTEPIIIQPVVSSAPQSLTATAGELFVYLTWTVPSNDGGSAITGYYIYRGTSSGEYTVTFATLNTNFNDTLVVGDTYYYAVTALNAIGECILSTEVSATPTEPTVVLLVAPSAPQSLTATADELFISLSWVAPSSDGGSAITGYHVYRKTSSSEYVLLGITTSTTYNDTIVLGETTFYYVVTAINAVGESVFSNEVSATPTGATVPKSGSFPDLFTVLLFFGIAVVVTRKTKTS